MSRAVKTLRGVGSRVAERLARLGIRTLEDLLLHLPLRYQDRTRISSVAELQPGDEALIAAEIAVTEIVRRGRRAFLCRVWDGSSFLTLRFFHFDYSQQKLLSRGTRLCCFGEVRSGIAGLEMIHPEWRLLDPFDHAVTDSCLTPVYPTTTGLHQATLRSLTEQALLCLSENTAEDTEPLLQELFPRELLQRLHLPLLHEAVRILHRPLPEPVAGDLGIRLESARRRLAFEELVAHHLSLRRVRVRAQRSQAPPLVTDGALVRRFLATLPFAVTDAQHRVITEVCVDVERSHPMLRLVQGDVGSGKTVVAAVTALQAIAAGFQVALMAPTELLAEQHHRQFRDWFEPLGLRTIWLGGKVRGKSRSAALECIRSGEAQAVIGTHALFQDEVSFSHLALVIIDEQHRFGVHQRLALREQGCRGERCPHQLIMTATPIPRTLAMAAYADLDTSVIDALPPGRIPVKTAVVSSGRRPEVVERVYRACRAGRQAYWVCTVIQESETLQCQTAFGTAEQLRKELPDLRVGLVHGRLKAEEKGLVMDAFKAGHLDLLVATTVIEVGVDVPNASLMIIENAERLGLAQLHQLRGRVGRGSHESSCVLMYDSPLSDQARDRLGVLRATNDGFQIAQRDLELRGPGEVLGTRQTGALQLRVADLMRDEDMLPMVQQAADELLCCHRANCEAFIRRWLGEEDRYAEV